MAIQFRLGRAHLQDLKRIRELETVQLQAVVDNLKQENKILLSPDDLIEELKKSLNVQEDIAESLVRVMLSLRGLQRQRDLSPDEIFQAMLSGIQDSDSSWTPEELKKWQEIEPILRELLSLRQVNFISKALDLAYEYANLLQNTRILTDIRPLFSEDASEIEGAVISYTLRLRYDCGGQDHNLSITLDEQDVKKLRDQCDRALKKAITAKSCMEEKVQVLTKISGD